MATTTPALSTREQVVTIYVDDHGDLVRLDRDPFHISKCGHQEVLWQTNPPNRAFSVVFDDSPFNYANFDQNNSYSGEARREVPGNGQYYKYTVTAGNITIDPGGVVDQ